MAAEIGRLLGRFGGATPGFNEAAANGRGNRERRRGTRRRCSRFNEAAANGRGNPTTFNVDESGKPASMRPRRMAAEIAPPHLSISRLFPSLQ